jgi:hypothetical protein
VTLYGSPTLATTGEFEETELRLGDGRWWGWGPTHYIGDINGDGYGDVSLGDVEEPSANKPLRGRRRNRILIGSSAGLRLSNLQLLAGEGEAAGSAQCLGDTNGDGRIEFAILPYRSEGEDDLFRIYDLDDAGNARLLYERNPQPRGTFFTRWAKRAGDVNGDGFGDIMIPSDEVGRVERGRFAVALGGDPLRPEVSEPLRLRDGTILNREFRNLDPQRGSCDFNGDGYTDYISDHVADDRSGRFIVAFEGSRAGLQPGRVLSADPVNTFVTCGSDLDGDGVPELLRVTGAEILIGTVQDQSIVNRYTLSVARGLIPTAELVLPGVDLNGDGFEDIALPLYRPGQDYLHDVLIVFGSSALSAIQTRVVRPVEPGFFYDETPTG